MIAKFDQWMTAITFAEADDSGTALQMMTKQDREQKRKNTKVRVVKRADNRPRLRT